MRSSLVITTYNWKEALELVLRGVARQRVLPDEVLIADDGSRSDTRSMLLRMARDFPVPVRHVWQNDDGFRVGRARNRAIAAARGDYLIMLDGDMLPHPRFVEDHLHHARVGLFLQGTRALVGEAATQRLLSAADFDFASVAAAALPKKNTLRLAWLAPWLHRRRRYTRKYVMSCNQSFWRDDLLRVNGFDERLVGWGREDTELAMRCYNAGLARIHLHHVALAVHLHHTSRAPLEPNPNDVFLEETERNHTVRCNAGIDQHLSEFALAPADLRTSAAASMDG